MGSVVNHLHGNWGSVAERCPMNVGDRTRREGLALERPVQLRHRLTELRLDRAHGDASGIGRYVRLERRELVGDVLPTRSGRGSTSART